MSGSKLTRFINLPASDKLLFIEAALTLFLSKILILICPFNTVARLLGGLNQVSEHKLTHSQSAKVSRIQHALSVVSLKVFWPSVCLDQALAAMIMLNRRRIPNTLCLGVKLNKEKQKLDAHAWVVCNDSIFIGGKRSANYRVVAFFSKY